MLSQTIKEVFMKSKLLLIKNKIDWFLGTDFFLGLCSLICVIFWATELEILGFGIMLSLGILIMLIRSDLKPLMVIILFTVFIASLTQLGSKAFFIFLAVFAPLFVGALVFYIVRNLPKRKSELTLGRLFLGFLIAGIVCLLSGLGYKDYQLSSIFIVFGMNIAGLSVYLLFLNTCEGDVKGYVCKLIMYACFIIMAQMFIFYFRCYLNGTLIDAFNNKTLRVGWGMTNSMAVFFAMGIPLMIYKSVFSKYNYLYLACAVLMFIAMFFTFSRGNLLFTIIAIPIALVYAFIRTPYRKSFMITFSIIMLLAIAVLLIFFDEVVVIAQSMFDKGMDDSGRFTLWELGIEYFKENPMFGVGFFGDDSNWPISFSGNILKFHSTAVTILASAGIVGVLGFILFYVQRYMMFFKKISAFKFFALIAVVLYELYGLMDLNFFIFYQIMFVIAISVAAEKETDKTKEPFYDGLLKKTELKAQKKIG